MAVDQELEDLTKPREAHGNQGLPLAKWKRLTDVFRAQGTHVSYSEAARLSNTTTVTAKKAFLKGDVRLRRPPIRDILLREAVAARAIVEKVSTPIEERIEAMGGDMPTRQAANKNAVATRAQEGRLVAGARVTAEICLAAAGRLLKAAAPLTEQLDRAIRLEIENVGTKDWGKLNNMLGKLFDYSREAVTLARSASELERLHLGAPEKTMAVTMEVTTAEAAGEIAALLRMLRRVDEVVDPSLAAELERAGVSSLRVIQGGKAKVG